jgi:uncharacterized membrane protein
MTTNVVEVVLLCFVIITLIQLLSHLLLIVKAQNKSTDIMITHSFIVAQSLTNVTVEFLRE